MRKKKTTQQKMGKDTCMHFYGQRSVMTAKYKKICSTLLINNEKQIMTITSTRLVNLKYDTTGGILNSFVLFCKGKHTLL